MNQLNPTYVLFGKSIGLLWWGFPSSSFHIGDTKSQKISIIRCHPFGVLVSNSFLRLMIPSNQWQLVQTLSLSFRRKGTLLNKAPAREMTYLINSPHCQVEDQPISRGLGYIADTEPISVMYEAKGKPQLLINLGLVYLLLYHNTAKCLGKCGIYCHNSPRGVTHTLILASYTLNTTYKISFNSPLNGNTFQFSHFNLLEAKVSKNHKFFSSSKLEQALHEEDPRSVKISCFVQ
ncbi:hypothetical protein VNO77_31943 [Canavalia gladiata]|uniref:Uncharacterized protein n=1 Tax=Canavalia gladiata TaxID=3824 RepID=A0AAN9KSW7_CANGL